MASEGRDPPRPRGTFGHASSRVGPHLFSLDRTFSASSSELRLRIEDESLLFDDPSTTSCSDRLKDSGGLVDGGLGAGACCDLEDEDEMSNGLPSDLPSGLVDIEGVLLGPELAPGGRGPWGPTEAETGSGESPRLQEPPPPPAASGGRRGWGWGWGW